MAKQSPAQQATVARVMHEFKQGELRQAGGKGPTVENPKQAIAIALHEAGSTNRESPTKNRANLARTRRKERRGETAMAGESREQLYAEARKKGIAGRSKMSKAELQRAITSAR